MKEAMITGNFEQIIYNKIEEKCEKYNFQKLAIGNTCDHIHSLIRVNPNQRISEFVKEVKGATSFIINKETDANLYWQNGYGVLSVSKYGVNKVKNYILNQKEHHRSKDNLIDVLEKY